MIRDFPSCITRLSRDSRGTVAIIGAMSMVGLVGVTGLSVDVGIYLNRQAELQASTDAAALAGAMNINQGSGGTAISTATSYSATSGNLNAASSMTVSMASGYPVLKCLTSTGVTCDGPDSANAIEVKQTASVPTYFARIFGFDTWSVSATSLASAAGGTNLPVDAVIILDSTESMNGSVTCDGVGTTSSELCAQAGIRTLLSAFSPCSATLSSCGTVTDGNVANPVDRVSLYTFPGVSSATAADDYNCSGNRPTIVSYADSPTYQIVPFSSDFRTSDTATSLNSSSDLVKASGGASGCTGIQAVGGVGTFYAGIINAAQTYLANDGFTTSQVEKVMIILSDGGANAKSSNVPAGDADNQCQQAITAAQAATAAGTTVYAVSYGSSVATGSSSTCTTDSSGISACSTMQQMASKPADFFADTSTAEGGGEGCTSTANPSFSTLLSIFQAIQQSISRVRLLPLNTT